jgi:DNA polymerase III delta subunit
MVILQKYLDEGHVAHELVPLIIWKVKQSAQVAALLDEGHATEGIAKILGASPYTVKQAASVCRSWGRRQVMRSLAAVSEAERHLKRGGMGAKEALERLILEICTENDAS